MTGPAWDRVTRVVMSTLPNEHPIEWTVEELPREPSQPENVRVFRYVYRQRAAPVCPQVAEVIGRAIMEAR